MVVKWILIPTNESPFTNGPGLLGQVRTYGPIALRSRNSLRSGLAPEAEARGQTPTCGAWSRSHRWPGPAGGGRRLQSPAAAAPSPPSLAAAAAAGGTSSVPPQLPPSSLSSPLAPRPRRPSTPRCAAPRLLLLSVWLLPDLFWFAWLGR